MNPIVPKPIVAKVEQYKKEIIDGKRDVYQGPIYKQDGSLAVAEGKFLTDAELPLINWYVKGIEGKVPQ